MQPTHAQLTTRPTRTMFLRGVDRHVLAAGVGLAKLAIWYASEDVPLDQSVDALVGRAGGDLTVVRVANECLSFFNMSPSTRSQVMALFMTNDVRNRVEATGRRGRSLRSRAAAAWARTRASRAIARPDQST